MSREYFELIQNTFSTLILDAVQYFPENVKKVHYESSGLLFGVHNEEFTECDYIFPVGSVSKRTKSSILSNPKVELAVKSSRELFSTSSFIGSYHSHPHEEYFPEWAEPSNGDVLYSLENKFPFELIIAITRNGENNKPLSISFLEAEGHNYFANDEGKENGWPKTIKLGYNTSFIVGEFQKYKFEIRAYQFTGESLKDVDIKSSEAELLTILNEENLTLENIQQEEIYRLRKLEYNLRSQQDNQKNNDNINYHLTKMRK